jgi:hypothetical protein
MPCDHDLATHPGKRYFPRFDLRSGRLARASITRAVVVVATVAIVVVAWVAVKVAFHIRPCIGLSSLHGCSYPAFAEVREKYLQLRERNLIILESLSEADLDKPTLAPPKGREREFATYGQSFLVLALHQAMHRDNLTDARRAVGRKALAARAA